MIVSEVFKVYLYPDPLTGTGYNGYPYELGEDITSGILNVDIVSGTDTYEGPQEQIDTGQFTIVTRNPAMDPKINPNLKYNSRIQFHDERSGDFFWGYVTDVQVQYQRNDNPIITITGTDIFGAMQRVVIDQDTHDAIMALSTGPTWNGLTFSEFISYMYDFTTKYLVTDAIVGDGPQPAGFWFEATQAFAESQTKQFLQMVELLTVLRRQRWVSWLVDWRVCWFRFGHLRTIELLLHFQWHSLSGWLDGWLDG
jgi:hypothetical protein